MFVMIIKCRKQHQQVKQNKYLSMNKKLYFLGKTIKNKNKQMFFENINVS